MSDKLEILKMIESGKITVDEGLQMIEALEQTEKLESEAREERYEKKTPDNEAIIKEIYGPSGKVVTKNLDVALTTCRLNIERSNVEEVTVELFDDKTREYVEKPEWLQLSEVGDLITIKESRVTNFSDIFDFFKSGMQGLSQLFINVKLPMEVVIDKGKFGNVSGNLSLIGINALDLDLRSVSGKVVAADVKARVLQMKSTSGNVSADNIKAANGVLKSTSGKVKFSGEIAELECKTISGNIEISTGEKLSILAANAVSGKVAIYLSTPEQYNLQLSSVSGGIDTSGFAVVDKSTSGKRSVSVTNRSESKSITASTISGKILIDKI